MLGRLLLLITSMEEEGSSPCPIVRIISLGSRALLEVAGPPRLLFPIILPIIISTTVDTIIQRTIMIRAIIILSSSSSSSRLPTLIIIMLAAAIIEGVTTRLRTAIISLTININKNALLNNEAAALPVQTVDSRPYSPSITSSRARPRST